jgi:hypothetical protein
LAHIILTQKRSIIQLTRIHPKRLLSDEDTGKNGKPKNKRLSIDTRFSEKLETNSALLEQMKSSYKVKQQQQAIIDQRTRIIQLK